MEVNLKIIHTREAKGAGKRRIKFGNPDFLLFFSIMLLCFGLFNLNSGAEVSFFAVYASGIFAFFGIVISVFRWKKLKPADKMCFCALFLVFLFWASLVLQGLSI